MNTVHLNSVHLNGVHYTRIMSPTRHDRDGVVDTALDLLDRVGLPDLSMRRLATELGVQPSALYWHFDSKQELLAAVADRILARIPDTLATVEPERALAAAQSVRDALLTYRDGAEVVMSTHALGLGSGRARDVLVTALGAGPDAEEGADVLLQFILGHTLLVQQRLHAQSYGAAADQGTQDPSGSIENTFDAGIRTFLAGLRSPAGGLTQ